MFSKKPNDSEDNSSENSQNQYPEYTPEPAAESEQSVYEGSSNRINPTKPSIISEGFEFVGTITSEGLSHMSPYTFSAAARSRVISLRSNLLCSAINHNRSKL